MEELIITKLEQVFREVFNNPTLVINKNLTSNDVDGWNSLKHMILISAIEKKFSLRFKLKELNKMRNVGDLLALIESKS